MPGCIRHQPRCISTFTLRGSAAKRCTNTRSSLGIRDHQEHAMSHHCTEGDRLGLFEVIQYEYSPHYNAFDCVTRVSTLRRNYGIDCSLCHVDVHVGWESAISPIARVRALTCAGTKCPDGFIKWPCSFGESSSIG